MFQAVFWAGLAGGAATTMEFAYAQGWVTSWWRSAWWILPLGALVNFAVYQLLRTDFGWLPSMVLFGAVTATLRLGLAFGVMGTSPTPANVAAAIVLIVGVLIKLFWR